MNADNVSPSAGHGQARGTRGRDPGTRGRAPGTGGGGRDCGTRGALDGGRGTRSDGRGLARDSILLAVGLQPVQENPTVADVQPSTSMSSKLADELRKVRMTKIVDRIKLNKLSADQKSKVLALREQQQVARCLLPDAPKRKHKRKLSPTRTPCPLVPGTPLVPPARKVRPWEVLSSSTGSISPNDSSARVDDVDEPVPSTSTGSTGYFDEPARAAVKVKTVKAKTSPKKRRSKLLFSPSVTGTPTVDELPLNAVVDAEIQLGFTTTSGTNQSVCSPSPDGSPSIPIIFDDNEDQIAEWDQNVAVNPGSDVEEDLLDADEEVAISAPPRVRNVEEYPAGLDDISPQQLHQLIEIDASDDTALREMVSSEVTLHFPWSSDPKIFTGEREQFSGPYGPTFATEGMTPLEIFEMIWDEAIIEFIVTETNRYASQLTSASLPPYSRLKRWSNINKSDLWTFFAVLMLHSFVPNPVEKEYWYPRLSYMRIGNFQDIMSHDKFSLIKRCLHFVDNTSIQATSSTDKKRLLKIMPILDHLNCKFSSLYLPEQNIAIDESLLLWKGKLSFSQLIATKAARVGIKSYELCESRTGYLWKMEVYTGKGHQLSEGHDVERCNEPEGAPSQIVLRLIRPLLNKGHTLSMDNFYNSPLLSRTLKSKKTDTIGTLRLNREFVPDSLKTKTKTNMRPGEIAFSQTQDLSVIVWRDANLVSLISTYHNVEVSGIEKHGIYKYKPKVVLDYNLSMGGVDKKDQLLQAFPVERIRNSIWYKKLFRRLLNISIHNAYVIFTHHTKMRQRQFRTILADQILKKYKPQAILPVSAKVPITGHFPVQTSGKRMRCKVCAMEKKESRTTWECEACQVSLCVKDCFKKYHTS